MSISTIKVIVERIRVSTTASPIAVFEKKDGQLDAVFAATIATQQRVMSGDPSFIGMFNKGMNRIEIKEKLQRHYHNKF